MNTKIVLFILRWSTMELNHSDILTMKNHKELDKTLSTAGGKILCRRCLAHSVRTKVQCAKPAVKSSANQKCQSHGGRIHTPDALARITKAHVTHGQTTKQAKEQYRQDAALLRELEDALHFLGIAHGPRTRGRKPAEYRPISTQADLIRLFKERQLHCV